MFLHLLDLLILQNEVAGVVLAHTIVNSLLMVTQGVCGAIPEAVDLGFIGSYPNPVFYICHAVEIALILVFAVLDGLMAVVDFHDATVDSAEIEATFENVNLLMDFSCSAEQTLAIIEEATACKKATSNLEGYGCDGIDNNCDKVIDECDEDEIDPTIDLSQVHAACSMDKFLFKDTASAEDCILNHVIASDDCQALEEIELQTVKSSSHPVDICVNLKEYKITAKEQNCEKTTTATFEIAYDPVASMSKTVCDMTNAWDELPTIDLTNAINHCTGRFFRTVNDAKACVDKYVTASAVCRNVDLIVKNPELLSSSDLSAFTDTYEILVRSCISLCYFLFWAYKGKCTAFSYIICPRPPLSARSRLKLQIAMMSDLPLRKASKCL